MRRRRKQRTGGDQTEGRPRVECIEEVKVPHVPRARVLGRAARLLVWVCGPLSLSLSTSLSLSPSPSLSLSLTYPCPRPRPCPLSLPLPLDPYYRPSISIRKKNTDLA